MLCECGCGNETKLARQTRAHLGHVKGQPLRFITGHYSRTSKHRAWVATRMRGGGETHHFWVGNKAGYGTLHVRLHASRGKASDHRCIACPKRAEDWALQRDITPPERIRTGQNHGRVATYSLNIQDYAPMCKACHQKYDKQKGVGFCGK